MPVRLGRFEMPKRLTKEDSTATETFAKFIAEPFETGYGHTIGNSLRRVLLSSLEGAAITSIKIDGAMHEFTTIDINVHDNFITIACDILLHHDCICPLRHRRTGKNPNRASIRHTKSSIHSRRLLANNLQSRATFAIARDNCVAVHCRVVEVRQRQTREVVFCCEMIERIQDRHRPRRQGPNRFQDFRARVCFADHSIDCSGAL